MNTKLKILLIVLGLASLAGFFAWLAQSGAWGVFNPQGTIAGQERNLIVMAVGLMLLVAIPLIATLFIFAWKYRAGNPNADKTYSPERTRGVFRELIWWIVPAVVVAAIAVINWQSTHALDPFKPIASNNKPITIQVVALQWKWLFIYPEQGIATVNFVEFPQATPVHFELTADAPMSSFWIPQLGSQIYAMSGMQTQMYLMASGTGEFAGRNTEINGEGFSGMNFTAKSVSQEDFDAWVAQVKQSPQALTMDTYNALMAPSENNPQALYSSFDKNLYDSIIAKPWVPASEVPAGKPAPTSMPANAGGAKM